MKSLIQEADLSLHKTKLGNADVVYIKGDVYPFKDILKKYQARWNKPNKFWFWFLDKREPQKTIDVLVKPALAEVKEVQNLPIEIDKLINAITTEEPAPSIEPQDKENTKKKLQEFKEFLINIEDDEQFKQIMAQVVALKAVQGYRFSILNALLIYIQDKKAGIVNNKSNWFRYYNRTIRKGAKPLMVWAPQGSKIKQSAVKKQELKANFYKKIGKRIGDRLTPSESIALDKLLKDIIHVTTFDLVPVYSEKDTIQIKDKEDFIAAAKDAQKEIKWFEENAISDEVRPVYKGLIDFSEDNGLNVELVDDLGGARGVSMSGKIQILRNEGNDVGLTKTLAHEIAHELLHQEYLKKKGGKAGSFYIGKDMGKEAIEQQAELSAWMFMYSFGFDVKTTSLNYTVMWGGNKDNMMQVFNTVSKKVNFLIDEVNKRINAALTEGTHTHGTHISPEQIADLTGFGKEWDELEARQGLQERLYKKINLI